MQLRQTFCFAVQIKWQSNKWCQEIKQTEKRREEWLQRQDDGGKQIYCQD